MGKGDQKTMIRRVLRFDGLETERTSDICDEERLMG
jgi:hypothetical protein